MAGDGQATSGRGVYRRRLAAAAAASLALHLLLARGLAVTSLGLGGKVPEAAAATQPRPKPRVDFTIRTTRSPAAPPAHERPLAIAAAQPAAERTTPARPAPRAASDRRPTEAAEPIAASAPGPAPERFRDVALDATPAPGRAAPAVAAQADALADSAAAQAPTIDDAAPAPGAAARSRDAAAAVASRWRPREVALLARLTAPTPSRPAGGRASSDEILAAATPADRTAADAAAAAATAIVDAATAPAGQTDAPMTTAPRATDRDTTRAAVDVPRGGGAPRDRFATRPAADASGAADLAAARSRREAARGDAASGRGPDRQSLAAAAPSGAATPLDAAGTAASETGGTPAPAPAPGSARRSGGGAAISGGEASGGTAAPGGTDGLPSGVAPDPRGIAALGGGGRGAADGVDFGTGRSPGRRSPVVGSGGGAGVADTAAIPAAGGGPVADDAPTVAASPRAVGTAAASASGDAPLAAAVRRDGSSQPAEDADDEAELSVPAIAPTATGRPRREVDVAAAGSPRPPERVAVVALPAEARVRDVAEAFARRGRDARPDRRADPRAARAEAVVDRGLGFLTRAQQADGRWTLGRFAGSGPADVPELASDTAATGLALLAFLGAGHDHFDGPHRDTVRRGLEFLIAVQKPDGDLYLPADELSNSCAWLYSHGIASIALCEAVGMTGDPLVRPAAAKACGFIAASQHPERGGWRYAPRSDADLSVSGWMLVALRSGALAGVETDPRALAGVRVLLDAAADADDPARYAYNPRKPDQRASELSSLSMTAVGALMRLHTGGRPDDPRVVAAAHALAAKRPAYDARGRDSYLWYYASQVLVHTGGPEWDAWYTALVDALAAAQETAGAKDGSWDPLGPRPDRWGRWGGRLYVTALHLLALEVPDRRLPTYTAAE